MAIEVLIPISMFASIFGIVYLFLTTRNKERMALIEKGADASLFATESSFNTGRVILSIALLAIGIGSGILFGGLFELVGIDDDIAYPAAIFIFAGLGLLASYFINNRNKTA